MRYLQVFIGLILLADGVKECMALPAALSALHVASAYSAGEAAGLIIGILAVLAGGVVLLARSCPGRRGSFKTASAF